MTPRVSVICIFFNGDPFIGEAIDSVLAQDFDDFELLLVDDGSTDSSAEKARALAAKFPEKVRYLEHEGHANRGASVTRNFGVTQARGELIAFIDADDRWRRSKLREQAAIFDSHPEVAMVCGSINYWAGWRGGRDRLLQTGRRADRISLPPWTILDLYPLGVADAGTPSDAMIRKATLEALGGFEEEFVGPLQLYEDQTLFTKLYLNEPVYFSSRTWLDYRIHDDSCVANVQRDGLYLEIRARFLDWLQAYAGSHDIADKPRVQRAIRRARWEVDHWSIGRVFRRLRRLTLAVRRLFQA